MGTLTEELEFTQSIDFPAKAENIALAEKLWRILDAFADHSTP